MRAVKIPNDLNRQAKRAWTEFLRDISLPIQDTR